MEEGKSWRKIFQRGREKDSVTPIEETVVSDMKEDLELLRACMDVPETIKEEEAISALERLFKAAERNPQIKAELQEYSKRYEDQSRAGEEDSEFFVKNEVCRRIQEWSQKQRLGKFYYDKNNPRRKLGS